MAAGEGKAAQTGSRRKRAQITSDDIGQLDKKQVDMPSNVATEDIDRPDLVVVTDEDMNSPIVKQYAQDLAFMEEIVTFQISASTDKNSEKEVPCGVNGVTRYFARGVTHKAPRKFIDSLIKVEDVVTTEQYKDKSDTWQTRVVKTPVMKYPINIIEDTPEGRRWFEWKCQNPW